MKITKMKKVILAMGLGLGLSAAHAGPGLPDYCKQLEAECHWGDANACMLFKRFTCKYYV